MSGAPSFTGYALVLVLSSSCALTGKADALFPRYFSPELDTTTTSPPKRVGAPLALRLGQVEAASYVEERFAYRVPPAELSYYEDRRWTEPPERYVRRGLERELFQNRGVIRTVSGPGSTLDVELSAFEEVRGSPSHVRLVLDFSLHDDRQSQLEQRVVVERPLPPSNGNASPTDVTAALSSALSAAISDVGDRVIAQLHAPAPQPCANTEEQANP